jgi:hypothetical protein
MIKLDLTFLWTLFIITLVNIILILLLNKVFKIKMIYAIISVVVIIDILPIATYLIFNNKDVNSFISLPIITKNVPEVNTWKTLDNKPVGLTDKITILGFIGTDVMKHKGNFFNLYETIYDKYKDFKDFQVVMVLPAGTQSQVEELLKFDIKKLGTNKGWNFVFASPNEITTFYNKLQLVGKLDNTLATPNVFIIDKKRNLRGRKGEDQKGTPEYKEGYSTVLVSELYNKMMDDMKIIIYEYRAALKKNRNATKKL